MVDSTEVELVFERLLRGISAILDFEEELKNLTFTESLRELVAISDHDANLRALIQSECNSRILEIQEKAYSSKMNLNPEAIDLKKAIIETIFYRLIFSSTFKYAEGQTPLKHHWIPKCYTKRFVLDNNKVFNGISFTSTNQITQVTVNDNFFVHKYKDGKGFYDLPLERFFSLVENAYSLTKTIGKGSTNNIDRNRNQTSKYINLAVFFIIQNLRHPNYQSQEFEVRTMEELYEKLVINLSLFEKIFVNFSGKSILRLGFTPYLPTSIRRTVNGTLVALFPFSQTVGVTISDKPIPSKEIKSVVKNSNISAVLKARKNRGEIFGLTERQLGKIFEVL